MGGRFRKSFKVAPGVRVNIGKKSVGLSVGGRGAGMSFNSRTGTRARVSVPGTGLSYSTKIGGSNKRKKSTAKPETHSSGGDYTPPEGPLFSLRRSWLLYFGLAWIAALIITDGAGIALLGIIIGPLSIIAWALKSAGDAILKRQNKKAAAAVPETVRVPASEYVHDCGTTAEDDIENVD